MDTTSFIPAKYLPAGMILKDPRNMHLDDIRKVLQHCYGLQAESGPESAFRFALFVGPKRKRLFSNYPDILNSRAAEPEQNSRKKKGKGKQREDALQGLLQMDELAEAPTPNHNEIHISTPTAGPSNDHSGQNDLVRIDMGQMLQLRDMGYEVFGPVNGPNEGYPEYEVPKAVLEALISHRQSQRAPSPNDPNVTGEPVASDPGPSRIDPALQQIGQAIDDLSHNTPALQDQVHLPTTTPNRNIGQSLPPPANVNPPLDSSDKNVRPTTPPIETPDPDADTEMIRDKTPKKRPGKRAQPNLSPQIGTQTRGKNKKKKLTDDDRAALEAQNMVQLGPRRRSKPTRRT
jgi:hypothetical protein